MPATRSPIVSSAWARPACGSRRGAEIRATGPGRLIATSVGTLQHRPFLDASTARWNEPPKLGAVVGYAMIKPAAAMLEKTGSTDTAAMAALEATSPFGPITWREIDHQATMGAFVGRTTVVNGEPTMLAWRYADGAAESHPTSRSGRCSPRAECGVRSRRADLRPNAGAT